MHVCPECGMSLAQVGFCPADGTALEDRKDDVLLGESVGQYRIARLIGVGGMGRVYKAVQPRINSRVAVKVLSHDCTGNPELVERFFAEARAVNLIRHENIINVLDLASLPDGRPYIIMEFLDGAPLATVLANHPTMPLGSLARIAGEILGALSAAHTSSIIHRDLKPDNIFITPQGRAKVLDFGIAKLMPELTGGTGPTRTGSLLGTPHYMAPEQANAQAIDARTDIYAMGVILYEGATGRRPLEDAQSLYDLLRQVIETTPIAPRALRPDIPVAFEAVINKAMNKSPDARFQSADAMAHALAAAVGDLPEHAWTPVGPAGERQDARIGPPSIATPSGSAPPGRHTPLQGRNPPRAATPSPVPHPLPSPLEVANTVRDTPKEQPPAAKTRSAKWLVAAGAAVLVAGTAAITVVAMSGQDTSGGSEAAPVAAEASTPGSVAKGAPSETATPANRIKAAMPAARAATNPAAANPAAANPAATTKATPAAAATRPPATAAAATRPPAPATSKQTRATTAPQPVKQPSPEKPPTPAAPATVATKSRAPAKQRKGRFNPRSFNVSGFLASAERRAKALLPDAVLVRIDSADVHPNGRADLTLAKHTSITYRFVSPSAKKRPKGVPKNRPYNSKCMVYVNVEATGVSTSLLFPQRCKGPLIGKPTCTVKEIWQRAIARGVSRTGALASIGYWAQLGRGDGRWHFSIKGVTSFWTDDDC